MTPKPEVDIRATEEAFNMGREALYEKADNNLSRYRHKLLDQLANTEGMSAQLERTLALLESESPALFANAQADLRKIWTRSTAFPEKQKIVDAWLVAATKRLGRAGIHAWLGRGRLEFALESFPGQFVTAILENYWRFQVCSNPECPAKYFFAKRSTQRYCERGECTRYAQRQHALKYWTDKGKFRRQKQEKRNDKAAKRTSGR